MRPFFRRRNGGWRSASNCAILLFQGFQRRLRRSQLRETNSTLSRRSQILRPVTMALDVTSFTSKSSAGPDPVIVKLRKGDNKIQDNDAVNTGWEKILITKCFVCLLKCFSVKFSYYCIHNSISKSSFTWKKNTTKLHRYNRKNRVREDIRYRLWNKNITSIV